jgi:hypothetical protein
MTSSLLPAQGRAGGAARLSELTASELTAAHHARPGVPGHSRCALPGSQAIRVPVDLATRAVDVPGRRAATARVLTARVPVAQVLTAR